ncbi:MAG: FGGY family carbohydrate kinase [Candidatus Binatia bacterium]
MTATGSGRARRLASRSTATGAVAHVARPRHRQGTTGVRALVFDDRSIQRGAAYEEIPASYPRPGWMEQDPRRIWAATQRVIGEALRTAQATPAGTIAAVGLAVQRASTLVEGTTGTPVYPVISWPDTRTVGRAAELQAQGIFVTRWRRRRSWSGSCASAICWPAPAPAGLCFGTVDSWLAWRLSGGRVHVTDHSSLRVVHGFYDFLAGHGIRP